MRYLYIIFLLGLPLSTAATTLPVPDTAAVSQPSFLVKQDSEKRGVLKNLIEKRLLKRLTKAEKSPGKSSHGDGKWLTISGLVIGVLVVLPWLILFDLGLFLSFPLAILSVIGLTLSILGLKKSQHGNGANAIKWLATIGIVFNALVLTGALIHLVIFQGR